MEDILGKYPNLDAFIPTGGFPQFLPDAYATSPAKYKAKIASGALALVVADTLPVQIDLLKAGLSPGQVGQRPFEMGYKAMYFLKDIKDGKAPPADPTYTGLDVCTPKTAATCIGVRAFFFPPKTLGKGFFFVVLGRWFSFFVGKGGVGQVFLAGGGGALCFSPPPQARGVFECFGGGRGGGGLVGRVGDRGVLPLAQKGLPPPRAAAGAGATQAVGSDGGEHVVEPALEGERRIPFLEAVDEIDDQRAQPADGER